MRGATGPEGPHHPRGRPRGPPRIGPGTRMKSIRELLPGLPPVTLPSSAFVLQAATTMQEAHVGAVLVTTDGFDELGIFSERDLMVRVGI